MKKISFIIFAIGLALFQSCEKKYDLPPLKNAAASNKINIGQIKGKYNNGVYRFVGDSNLYCVVTADEVSGNLYKDIFVQDVTGAIHVKLIGSGGLYIGDSIRINLKNCLLNAYNNLIQLDSVDNEKNIVKLAAGLTPKVTAASIKQVNSGIGLQSALVELNGVEFIENDRGMTYADAVSKNSGNRILKSCDGQTLTVRTGGYANFAGKLTPTGNGSIKGIVSQFGTSMQFLIRQISDVNLSDALCMNGGNSGGFVYLSKNFNDNNLNSGGWTVQTVSNTAVKWTCSSYSGTPTYSSYAKISGYVNGTNNYSEVWLISPTIDLSNASQAILNFETATGKFAGTPLDVLISKDYTGGLPSTGTWNSVGPMCVLSPTTSNYVWTPSGDVALTSYQNSNVHVAFKYKSTVAAACTYELDNIYIKEK